MTDTPNYIRGTLSSSSLCSEGAAARREPDGVGGRRSIDLRPKYLNPISYRALRNA